MLGGKRKGGENLPESKKKLLAWKKKVQRVLSLKAHAIVCFIFTCVLTQFGLKIKTKRSVKII